MRKLLLPLFIISLFAMQTKAQVRIQSMSKSKADKQNYPPDWAYVSNIYEVNIRQYTPEGTIEAFRKHLPRLKNMGVDILWLMPVQPIGKEKRKGSKGSYYSISDYMAVNPEFGSMEDFIRMVDDAHVLGMKVILDWVANHTAFDHYWTKTQTDFYVRDAQGNIKSPVDDWSDVADLNYDNQELRKAMIRNMKFWVNAADIDGFRCDVAFMVPTDFWQDARRQLEAEKPGLFMLAEAEDKALHDRAFDMSYGWEFHHLAVDIAKGKKNADSLRTYLKKVKETWPPNAFHMYFTDNHDENSWNKTSYERFGKSLEAFSVLTFALPGMPLIYSGQEAANNKVIKFFEKDTIDFKSFPLEMFYTKLTKLKSTNPALMHGERGGSMIEIPNGADASVMSFFRKKDDSKILFIFNLSNKDQKINLNSPELSGLASDSFGLDTKPAPLTDKMSLKLKPWEFKVYNYSK
jgi:glycosidase